MSLYLGFDTSNYTTSAALYDPEQNTVWNAKKLLPVKPGEKGIRQSDAVFHHTQQLPELLEAIHEIEGLHCLPCLRPLRRCASPAENWRRRSPASASPRDPDGSRAPTCPASRWA